MKKVKIAITALSVIMIFAGQVKAQYNESSLEFLLAEQAKIIMKMEGPTFPPIFRIVNGNFEVLAWETKTGLFTTTTWTFQGDSIVLTREKRFVLFKKNKTKNFVLCEWDRRVSYKDKRMLLTTFKYYNEKNPKFLRSYLK